MDDTEVIAIPVKPVEPSREAFRWMATLPSSVRPIELARHFPRIVNHLALYWHYPNQCERYLSDLIFDKKRPHRTGFNFAIAAEILRLHTYFCTSVCPTQPEAYESRFNFTMR